MDKYNGKDPLDYIIIDDLEESYLAKLKQVGKQKKIRLIDSDWIIKKLNEYE